MRRTMSMLVMRTLVLLGCGLALGPLMALTGGSTAARAQEQALDKGFPEKAEGSKPEGSKPEVNPTAAPDSEKPAVVSEELVTAPFIVDQIDKHHRRLTLHNPGGEKTTITVPEDVQGFDKLKKGDKLDIDYYQSVAVAVLPPGSAIPSMKEQEESRRSATGGAMRGRQITASAEVLSVHSRDNTIQVKGANGKAQTISVTNPALQDKLTSVKPGDVVKLTYTEAVAAAIRPQPK